MMVGPRAIEAVRWARKKIDYMQALFMYLNFEIDFQLMKGRKPFCIISTIRALGGSNIQVTSKSRALTGNQD